ncbi:MAG: hypothetical protein A2Y22_08845 [Clostridiales bacterium GWD2_32_59]|nr:MAG: hypothetical protein A2Y22_08845 [Clostridiales bacterium GWD2_32_59]
MKQLKYIVTSILFMVLFVHTVFALDIQMPDMIRVGLESYYKELNKIDIGSKEIVAGNLDGDKFTELFSMSSNSGFSMYADYKFYVGIDKEYFTYADAKSALGALEIGGVSKCVAYVSDGMWEIYLGEYASQSEMNSGMISLAKTYPELKLKTVVATLTRNYIVSKDSNDKIIFENSDGYVCFTTRDRLISLITRKYKGYIQFVRVDSGKMTAVNTVLFNEYLYGVVCAEMGPSWHIEALKAQTIAIKNYVILIINNKKYKYYNISDTTNDQAYKGYSIESENARRAVNETTGEVLLYDGKLASTFYFSSSGGYTEDSQNVWTNTVAYLKAVKDIYEKTNSHSNWEVTISKNDINTTLLSLGKYIGDIVDLKVKKSEVSGRVLDFTIVGTSGTHTLQKESIRTFFKPILGSILKSRDFDVIKSSDIGSSTVYIKGSESANNKNIFAGTYVRGVDGSVKKIDSSTGTLVIKGSENSKKLTTQTTNLSDDKFVLRGSGWGHAVGMSQYGAKGMAEEGFKYDEILRFYYTGTNVFKVD